MSDYNQNKKKAKEVQDSFNGSTAMGALKGIGNSVADVASSAVSGIKKGVGAVADAFDPKNVVGTDAYIEEQKKKKGK